MVQNKNVINTIPEGVWEAGQTNESLHACHRTSPTVDGQKNGYPPKKKQPDVQDQKAGKPEEKHQEKEQGTEI